MHVNFELDVVDILDSFVDVRLFPRFLLWPFFQLREFRIFRFP